MACADVFRSSSTVERVAIYRACAWLAGRPPLMSCEPLPPAAGKRCVSSSFLTYRLFQSEDRLCVFYLTCRRSYCFKFLTRSENILLAASPTAVSTCYWISFSFCFSCVFFCCWLKAH